MKSKRLIILLSILIFVTVLIVLNSTLFTLQNVSVNWLTTKNTLQNVKDYELVKGVSKGQSIFLVKKDIIAKDLEKEHPYLRVVSIETKFPNKIVVHTAERQSLYAIKLTNEKDYAVLDENGKVLKIDEYDNIFESNESTLETTPIKIEFKNNLSIKDDDLEEGEFIKINNVANLLSTLSLSLRESGYEPLTSKGVLKSIQVESNGENTDIWLYTWSGLIIKVNNIEGKSTEKLLLGFSVYNTLLNSSKIEYLIDVTYVQNQDDIAVKIFRMNVSGKWVEVDLSYLFN